MKNSFKDLVGKMQSLQQDQQGKLKGGFAAASPVATQILDGTNKDNCNNSGTCSGDNGSFCTNTTSCL